MDYGAVIQKYSSEGQIKILRGHLYVSGHGSQLYLVIPKDLPKAHSKGSQKICPAEKHKKQVYVTAMDLSEPMSFGANESKKPPGK